MTPAITSEKAAAACVAACLDQIRVNRMGTLDSDAPEGPHQLRVGLRRLRSALRLFRPVIGSPEATRLSDLARELGREAGRTRDLDVFCTAILPDLTREVPEPEAARLQAAFEGERLEERARLRRELEGAEVAAFLADLEDFVRLRRWLLPEDHDQTERLARPLRDFADESLAHIWKKTRKMARHLSEKDVHKRHEFRKDLKKLRYAVDFLSPVYPKAKMKPFLKRLAKLQDKVGALNDVVTARALLEDAEEGHSPALDRALRLLETRSVAELDQAQDLWRALSAEERPWERRG
jgi:triphosphatase